jgi:hypothetical protein
MNTDGSSSKIIAMPDMNLITKALFMLIKSAENLMAIPIPALGLMAYQTDAIAGFCNLDGTSCVYFSNNFGIIAIVNGNKGSTILNFIDLSTNQIITDNKAISYNTSVGFNLAVTDVATLMTEPFFSNTTASQALFNDAYRNPVSNPITVTINIVMIA